MRIKLVWLFNNKRFFETMYKTDKIIQILVTNLIQFSILIGISKHLYRTPLRIGFFVSIDLPSQLIISINFPAISYILDFPPTEVLSGLVNCINYWIESVWELVVVMWVMLSSIIGKNVNFMKGSKQKLEPESTKQ